MKRKNPNATSVSEVAGNGLLDRRALLGRGMFFAGVAAAGVGTVEQRRRRSFAGRSLEHGAGGADPALWRAGEIREQGRPHAHQSQQRGAHQQWPHAASSPRRHHHAERLALRGGAIRLPGYRSREAPPGDPRSRQAAAGVRPRGARALPQGHAHPVRRMRRQQRAALQQGPGRRPTCRRSTACLSCSEWTGVRLSTLARGDRHRPQGEVAARGRRRRAEHEPQHSARQGARRRRWSRSTRTASASTPRRAIRCGSWCPATKAT